MRLGHIFLFAGGLALCMFCIRQLFHGKADFTPVQEVERAYAGGNEQEAAHPSPALAVPPEPVSTNAVGHNADSLGAPQGSARVPWRDALRTERYDPLRNLEHNYCFWRSLVEVEGTLAAFCSAGEVNTLMQFYLEFHLACRVCADPHGLFRLPSPENCLLLKRITVSTFRAVLGDERLHELLMETMPPLEQEAIFGEVFQEEYRLPALVSSPRKEERPKRSEVWAILDPTRPSL